MKTPRTGAKEDGTNLTIKLPNDVRDLLTAAAKRDRRSNGNMAVVLIQEAAEARLKKPESF